jgi:hypothetical protein
MEVLLANEECMKIVKGWFMNQGDISTATSLSAIRDMTGYMKLAEMEGTVDADLSTKKLAQLNRLLNKISKC